MLSVILLSVVLLSVVILSVVILSVVMLRVLMLSVIMLSVRAPKARQCTVKMKLKTRGKLYAHTTYFIIITHAD